MPERNAATVRITAAHIPSILPVTIALSTPICGVAIKNVAVAPLPAPSLRSAVAMGMVIISEIAWKNGLSKERCQDEIIDALLENNLPISCPYKNSELYYAAENDKKSASGRISIIIPEKIGNCIIHNLPLAEFKELLY